MSCSIPDKRAQNFTRSFYRRRLQLTDIRSIVLYSFLSMMLSAENAHRDDDIATRNNFGFYFFVSRKQKSFNIFLLVYLQANTYLFFIFYF